ncbi:MAG: hypothetical protein E7672_09830, partial [Ruminococcaceae bacterium]|nr:hypothetical protein [Oscillospiraceae bacterium]
MTKIRKTKNALIASILSLLLCVSMFAGTTMAWFTDSVSSANNIIKSGNLDVVLEYWNANTKKYEEVTSSTYLFDNAAIWEPGHVEVAYLKISNAGSLALKYQLAVNVYSEVEGKTFDGKDLKLSDHLVFKVVDGVTDLAGTYTRETAMTAAGDVKGLNSYNSGTKTLEAKDEQGTTNYEDYVALIVYMPATVGNEANHDGEHIPQITLGTTVLATQVENEEDSFGNDYDKDAEINIVDKSSAIVNNNGKLGEAVVLTADMPYGEIKVTVPAGTQLSSAEISELRLTVENAEANNNVAAGLTENQVAAGYVIYVE